MAPHDYQVVPYRAEYTSQILQLQRHLWGDQERINAAYLDWKYIRNPYIRDPLIYLALHDGEVVAMRGFVGSAWEFGGPRQTTILPLTSDVVTAPAHRRRGLLKLIMEAALKDLERKAYSYTLCMAAVRVTCLTHAATGWQTIGSLRPMDCFAVHKEPLPKLSAFLKKSSLAFSAVQKLRSIRRKLPVSALPLASGFRDLSRKRLSSHICIETAPRGREMVKLKRRLTKDARIRHVYDEPYYAWRFQNPRNRYRFLFWDGTELEGYLILQTLAFPNSEPIGIVDWEGSSERIKAELLQAARQLVDERGLAIWSGTLPENDRRILQAAGFSPRASAIDDPQTAEVRPLRCDLLKREWCLGDLRLLDFDNWDFRMLHSRAF